MINFESYLSQLSIWPREGQHILAQFDDESVIVYQAYNASIGHFAAREGTLGGDWSLNRMSWFKPNFLWMMYRCGWGTKENQEVTLAIRIRRAFFNEVLKAAVPSSFDASNYSSHADWQAAVAASEVRLQWDPDHDPSGAKCERRAVQLGLRGETLRRYAREEIVEIEDISAFVTTQRENARGDFARLVTPRERNYDYDFAT